MYQKLEKKIRLYIFLSTLVFILLASALSMFFISRSYVNNFKETTSENVNIAIQYSYIKINNIVTDGQRLVNEDAIISNLGTSTYQISINPLLNSLRSQYQEEIMGIVLYSSNDIIYKSDSLPVSDLIPFETFEEMNSLAGFFTSSLSTKLFLYTQDNVLKYINIFIKIETEDTRLGYLLLQLSPDYLFNEFFTFSDNTTMSLVGNYITLEDSMYYPSANRINEDITLENQTAEYGFIPHQEFYVKTDFYGTNSHLINIFETTYLRDKIIDIIFPVVIINIVFSTAAYIVGKSISKSIVNRLTALSNKMDQTEIDIR